MRVGRLFLALLFAAGLAGCYTADKPFLTDANSVAPYARITFRDVTAAATETATMTRVGTAYTVTEKDGAELNVRFMATDRPNWFVAQMISPPTGFGLDLLYAVIRVDTAKHQAQSFKALATDPKVITPGHHLCNDLICIDDIKAYAAQAIAYAEMGGAPDIVYDIALE